MKQPTHHSFTMIEVVLALGVIAIGVVSVLALFPVGIKAGTDAMATDYSAQVADQMLHWLEQQVRVKTVSPAYDGWVTYISGGSARISTTAPTADDFTPTYTVGETLYADPGTNGRYKIIRFVDKNNNNTYDSGTDILDYSAMAVVWQSQVSVPGAGGPTPLSNAAAAALNVEVSWPAQLPYASREKRIYSLELFNR